MHTVILIYKKRDFGFYFCCFLSGSEMENSAFPTSDCLSLQCTKFAKLFIGKNCGTDYAQICNKTRK